MLRDKNKLEKIVYEDDEIDAIQMVEEKGVVIATFDVSKYYLRIANYSSKVFEVKGDNSVEIVSLKEEVETEITEQEFLNLKPGYVRGSKSELIQTNEGWDKEQKLTKIKREICFKVLNHNPILKTVFRFKDDDLDDVLGYLDYMDYLDANITKYDLYRDNYTGFSAELYEILGRVSINLNQVQEVRNDIQKAIKFGLGVEGNTNMTILKNLIKLTKNKLKEYLELVEGDEIEVSRSSKIQMIF